MSVSQGSCLPRTYATHAGLCGSPHSIIANSCSQIFKYLLRFCIRTFRAMWGRGAELLEAPPAPHLFKRRSQAFKLAGRRLTPAAPTLPNAPPLAQRHRARRLKRGPNSANRRGAATAAESRAAGVAPSGLEAGRGSKRDPDERPLHPMGHQIDFSLANRKRNLGEGAGALG